MKEKYDVPIAPESEFISYMIGANEPIWFALYGRAGEGLLCVLRAHD